MHHSDPALIRDCLDGKQGAWDHLIDRYGRLVYSIPRRYGMSDPDADDVTQIVFSILFRRLSSLRDDTRLSSWLITTTHRECWRLGKRGDSAQAVEQAIKDPAEPVPEQVDRWERQHLIRRGLTELGGRCEQLLRMLFYAPAEPDYRRIAEQLNISIGSIGPTRGRCFDKLRRVLERMGFGPGGDDSRSDAAQ